MTIAVIGLLVGGTWAFRYTHGASFVIRAANLQGAMRRLADLDTVPETERTMHLSLGQEVVRARVYVPQRGPRHTALLVSGLHPAGIDEPRLVAFARELARTRVTVVTPDISELTRFEITPALTDHIEQAAMQVAADAALAPTGRIGLMGISFSGGLSVVAAGRPALRSELLYVFSLGGHDDLPRVLRYLSMGIEPVLPGAEGLELESRQTRRPPHDYGVALVLLTLADRLGLLRFGPRVPPAAGTRRTTVTGSE